MRSIVWTLFVMVGLSFCQTRIAHVDTRLIFESFQGITQVRSEYEAQLAVWEQQANVLQAELNQLKETLEKQAIMLSEARRQDLEGQLAAKQQELQKFIDEIYGPQGKMVKENQKITAPALKKIKEVISEIALQEGYDMVLDRATGALVFWKDEDDLTQFVINALKSEQ